MNIVEYLKQENADEVAIAMMDIERNNSKDLSSKEYSSLRKVYDYYLHGNSINEDTNNVL